ncbi:terminase large subunit [Streptomyces phage Attoomi]|uniref:Terminase large subunit n=1 Tax=Streptomyces phage Attoomi TaxID=2059881 RepID=A0A2H5BLJ5_9CAUD|nr:terminase large subunit [Streptomyces phage Attoomi]AUG87135.1 terminase large subunit [Streptomyces phage Attoomi]
MTVLEPVRTWPDTVPDRTRTLGWDVLLWTARYLRQPDGPDAGKPWRFTPEQVRIVLRWFEINDAGEFTRRQGTIRRLKGWGKDPFLAAIAAVEFVGPCRFGGWREDGTPKAIPHPAPWVQVCAVSKDQTRNTMRLFGPMFSDELVALHGIDVGKEIIYARNGAVIEAVTSSPRALEGGRSTFVIMNETHHWIAANGGHEMAMTIAGNVGKSRGGGARTMEITNAPLPGEDSVAEQTWHAWSKFAEGKSRDSGMYYDSVEAPPIDMGDPDQLRAGIIAARGDADWLDVEWILSTIYSGHMPRSRSQRMFLNQLVTAEDQLISPADWDALAVTAGLTDGDAITLGFDGGLRDDATALVAMRVRDRLIVPLGVWERPDGPAGDGWEVDRLAVDGAVRNALERYDVQAFFADVALWESYVDAWSEDYRDRLVVKASPQSAVGRDMRGGLQELTLANERLMSAIENGQVAHIGTDTPLGKTLRRHVLNARRRPNRFGLSFGKANRESAHKIDAYAATLLADLARHRLIESGKSRAPERAGSVYFF